MDLVITLCRIKADGSLEQLSDPTFLEDVSLDLARRQAKKKWDAAKSSGALADVATVSMTSNGEILFRWPQEGLA
jgi:hypothetical protein